MVHLDVLKYIWRWLSASRTVTSEFQPAKGTDIGTGFMRPIMTIRMTQNQDIIAKFALVIGHRYVWCKTNKQKQCQKVLGMFRNADVSREYSSLTVRKLLRFPTCERRVSTSNCKPIRTGSNRLKNRLEPILIIMTAIGAARKLQQDDTM